MKPRKKFNWNSFLPLIIVTVVACFAYSVVRDLSATSDASMRLLLAADHGNTQRVRQLLHEGMNPNFSFRGSTPLSVARERGFTDVIKILKEAGAR